MRTSFHHQPEAQHPIFQLSTSWQADYPIFRQMLLKKDFEGGLRATLIQDQGQTRNLDSKIYLLGFHRFKFEFHSFFAETFSTVSVRLGHSAVSFNVGIRARTGEVA